METTSPRICEREGCDRNLDLLGLKSTAKCCSPNCRREYNRAKGDGAERVWISGRWKAVRPPKPRTRRRNVIPGVDLTSPVESVLRAVQAGTA